MQDSEACWPQIIRKPSLLPAAQLAQPPTQPLRSRAPAAPHRWQFRSPRFLLTAVPEESCCPILLAASPSQAPVALALTATLPAALAAPSPALPARTIRLRRLLAPALC